MKKTKKLLSVLLAVLLLCVVLTACKSDKLVIEETAPTGGASAPENTGEELLVKVSDTCIIVKTTQDSLEGKTDMLLIDYMTLLKEEGKLDFSLSDGMITSINGIENPADYSSCWMLYTSDADNANAAWGTVEYQGKEYGSALVGAEALTIKPDQLYIWVYKSFS